MSRIISLALFAVCAAGCVTKYQPLSRTGGYVEVPLGADKVDVSFSGSSMLPPDMLEVYLLYRCAEVTKAAGHDYFTIEARSGEPRGGGHPTHPQYVRATIEFSDKKPSGKGEHYKVSDLEQQLEPYIEDK